MFGFFESLYDPKDKDKESVNSNTATIAGENDMILAKMQDLSVKLGGAEESDAANQRNIQRLRKEGGGR